MKRFLVLLVLISAAAVVRGEEPSSSEGLQKKYPVNVNKNQRPKSFAASWPRWSVHSNLLGFVQFGPVVTAEYNITRQLAFGAHARFPSVGALTPVLHHAGAENGGRPDKISGIAFGGGPLLFFKLRRDLAYIGLTGEYEMSDVLYLEDYVNEWRQDNRKVIAMVNGGYRFLFAHKLIPASPRKRDTFFREGLFMNAGFYAGAERNQFQRIYTDPEADGSDVSPREGTTIKPFGMIELSVGLKF